MPRRINVRAAHASADNDEVARIVSAANPDWPRTGAEIAAVARRRGTRFHRKFVAESAPGELTGFGFLEGPDVAAIPGRFRLRVTVDPTCLGQGIGAALYQAIEDEARRHGATELCSEVLASQPRAQRFAFDRGFVVYNCRIESRLGLRDVDPGRVARGIDVATDDLFDTGLRIASYRQLAQDGPATPRRLYELFFELWRDVPFGIRGDDPTYESFVAEELDDPAFRPAGTFVALDGSNWVGLCVQCTGRDHLLTSMTGVVRRWRRCGLARWLKLHSIRYALETGAREILTYNDESNSGMLALNRALGFVPVATDLRLKKELG
jgi:GNAT superfamily N-acetyltransferase